MKSVIDWISFIALLLSYFSFMYMADHLYRKKVIKHRLFGFRPDIVFVQYFKLSKEEYGHVGIWFWITISSFTVMMLASILSLILHVLVM